MGIIVKFSEALSCVKSPISRTTGAIYVVMCVENVLVRTPWKETWLESDRASVETTKGWNVSRESEGKRVGRGWKVCRGQTWDCAGCELWGWETGQDKSSRAGGADGAVMQGHGKTLPGTAWRWHCDIRGAHGDNYEVQCGLAVRKKPRFTHVRDNLRGDVRGKRFSTHAMERNVVRIGEIQCRDDKGMESAEGE